MPVLVALAGFSQAPADREQPDQVRVVRGQSQYDLDWSDAEDRMHGSLRPLDPVATRPLELSVIVGTFQGADFDGPVTMTLRCPSGTQTQTVVRQRGEKGWLGRFTPQEDGECSLDLGFTTTRHKLLHWKLDVTQAPLSRVPWYVLLVVLALSSLGFGLRALFKKEPV